MYFLGAASIRHFAVNNTNTITIHVRSLQAARRRTSTNMNDHPSERRTFVIGSAFERITDWRQLNSQHLVGSALTDAGLPDRTELIRLACVDRAIPSSVVSQHLPAGISVLEITNRTLNGPKTLLLARHLLQQGGIDCVLALGIDRHRTRGESNAPNATTRADSTNVSRRLIRDFDLVQRRRRFRDDSVWQQIEQFQLHWCDEDVLCACLLASGSFVREHALSQKAVAISEMQLSFRVPRLVLPPDVRVNIPRMINALGFAGISPQPKTGSIAETGLVHCALISRLLRAPSGAIDANAMWSLTNTANAKEAELLLAQYDRYDSSDNSSGLGGTAPSTATMAIIKAKL